MEGMREIRDGILMVGCWLLVAVLLVVGPTVELVFLARLIPAKGISCVSAFKYLINMSAFFCA
jgi:hypothetical protein